MSQTLEMFMTAQELAEALKVAKPTIYAWADRGFLPHVKLGDCIRFKRSEVEEWLRQHSKGANDGLRG